QREKNDFGSSKADTADFAGAYRSHKSLSFCSEPFHGFMPHTETNHGLNMKRKTVALQILAVATGALVLWLSSARRAEGAVIWDGPTMTFAETTTDWTQPMNQDRMTDNVWITRGPFQGIFNAKTESG